MIRPKKEMSLLIEFAFRSMWKFDETLKEQFDLSIPRDKIGEVGSALMVSFAAQLHKMHPDGNSRTFSPTQSIAPVCITLIEKYNEFINWYLENHPEIVGLPITLSIGKVELAMREKIDEATDAIYNVYLPQNQES